MCEGSKQSLLAKKSKFDPIKIYTPRETRKSHLITGSDVTLETSISEARVTSFANYDKTAYSVIQIVAFSVFILSIASDNMFTTSTLHDRCSCNKRELKIVVGKI